MNLLYPNQIDRLAPTVRGLLARPPWQRGSDIDTGTQAAFRRFRPGMPPHSVPTELIGAVWQRAWFPDDAAPAEQSLAAERTALVLHLLARNPLRAGCDLGAACRSAGLTDRRFVRLMGTPHSQRLEQMSRLMQRLNAANVGLRWAGDADTRSMRWSLRDTRTDEVWPLCAFLFGRDSDPAIARWAAGFFGQTEDDASKATPAAASA
jgi:hypothetical protein